MATLYEDLRDAGVKICNHCSDLYFEYTDVSREILSRHKDQIKLSSLFMSQHPGDNKAVWCDTSFAYDPFWQRVENEARARTRDAEKTTG